MSTDPRIELEQRIKTLEHEVNLLHNDLNDVLLNIQEQVLLHFYPDLMPEEDPFSDDGELEEDASLAADEVLLDEPPAPAARKVTLEEMRARQDPSIAAGEDRESQQDPLKNLSEWVTDSASKLGGDRAASLLEVYSERGLLPLGSEITLLQLASDCDQDDSPVSVAVNEMLDAVMKLNELLGRDADAEEAISLIEEAHLG